MQTLDQLLDVTTICFITRLFTSRGSGTFLQQVKDVDSMVTSPFLALGLVSLAALGFLPRPLTDNSASDGAASWASRSSPCSPSWSKRVQAMIQGTGPGPGGDPGRIKDKAHFTF